MSDVMRRRFLADCPDQDPNPTLRDLLPEESSPTTFRNGDEDKVFAAMPGDDLSSHPLGPHTDNPYFSKSYSELQALIQSKTLDRAEHIRVLSALDQYDKHHLHPYTGRVR